MLKKIGFAILLFFIVPLDAAFVAVTMDAFKKQDYQSTAIGVVITVLCSWAAIKCYRKINPKRDQPIMHTEATVSSDANIDRVSIDYAYDEDQDGLWSDERRRDFYEAIDESDLQKGNRYQILYTDYNGITTERNIVLIDITHNKRGDIVLQAWCELRSEMRSFKLRNIDEIINLETGEIVK